jgi:hypothetical protein
MSLDDVVDLSIDINSLKVGKENFGTPLFLGYHIAWIDVLVKEYANPKEMLTDGFSASHYLYKAALAWKSQNPTGKTFKIGRRTTALTQIVHTTPTITTEGFKLTWTIAGHAGSYTIPGAATIQSIVEAISPTIDAYTEVTATEDNTKIVVTSATAGTPYDFSMGNGWTVSDETADTTTDDALAAILVEDSNWYGLNVIDSFSKATGLLSAATIEAERKMNVLLGVDSAILNAGSTTDIFYVLQAANYARTVGQYARRFGGTEWAHVALLAKSIAETPGKVSWAHKSLAGISVDTLSQAEQNAIHNKDGNYYITLGAQGDTFDGRTFAGEFADITHFVDFLYSSIRLRVVAMLQSGKKVPYTDSGVDTIRSGILAVLVQNVGRNGAPAGLAESPAPSVTAPKVADVDPADRAARFLPDVEFQAQLQGAIHTVEINGTLSV